MKKTLMALIFCVFAHSAIADVQGDIGTFFTHLNFEGNLTGTSAYQGQEAGYYSGGSAYLRTQVKDAQFVHVDLPSYSAGCGGIDLYTGGFSFITSDELIKYFKQVMANAGGYAYSLALQTYIPQMKAVTDQLVDWSNTINNQNMSSCELSQNLVGGLMPKVMGMQKAICKDVGSRKGVFNDWVEGRQKCNELKTRQKTTPLTENDSNTKKQNLLNKNLMWAVLRENAFLSSDNELAEFCMSLTGTMIFDEKNVVTTLPPLIEDKNVIRVLLYGGDAKIYICDDSKKCLSPHKGNIHIEQSRGLINKVIQMINAITSHIQDNTALTDEEISFVNSTPIPVVKYASVGLMKSQKFQSMSRILCKCC